jgi:hypothetical protein
MQRFRSMKTLQKFSSVHAQFHNHFNQERHQSRALQAKTLGRVGGVARSCGLNGRSRVGALPQLHTNKYWSDNPGRSYNVSGWTIGRLSPP